MPRRKEQDALLAADIQYLDPLGCDSTVAYKIVKRDGGSPWASVTLSDCERHINWYFYRYTPISKLDKAIELLTSFREELVKVRKRKVATKKKVVKSRASRTLARS